MNTLVRNVKFILNSELIDIDINPATVVLDYVRTLRLTGTKEGCKEGDCGACTVLVGESFGDESVRYKPINSCLLPLQNVYGKHVVTIEGINPEGKSLSPIQSAFLDEGASQCGFCTPGFIISLTGHLLNGNNLNYNDVIDSLDGNICRCTGHNSIIRAAEKISTEFNVKNSADIDLPFLVRNKIVPEYFVNIASMLKDIRYELPAAGNSVNEKFYFVSGGTDLFVQKPELMLNSKINFLEERPDLHFIKSENGLCRVGALSTVTELLESEVMNKIFPSISKFAELFGSTPIRNSATVGGNLVNASPIGDMTALFMALNSNVVLSNNHSTREVPLKKFYKGYKSIDKNPDEHIHEIIFRIPVGDYHFNFEKVSKRTYLDIASVNSAILITMDGDVISDVNISAGGVAATPLHLFKTCEFLKGKEIDSGRIREAAAKSQTEISPISDARGSAEYKQLLLSRLIYTHFIELFPEKINVAMCS